MTEKTTDKEKQAIRSYLSELKELDSKIVEKKNELNNLLETKYKLTKQFRKWQAEVCLSHFKLEGNYYRINPKDCETYLDADKYQVYWQIFIADCDD